MKTGGAPFLGRGWSFPPRVTPLGARTEMVEGHADIEQSLFILLSTWPGERVMVPGYGCDLQRFVLADLTRTLLTELCEAVRVAILRWEPRIDLLDVSATPDLLDSALVRIGIEYRVRTANTRNNLVFPFYRNEGTLVHQP
ncbi:GPW/gp25 family protein [Sphingomonas sp. IC-56]|uniref:GPW/gp25 family protein n=1 Tax=Sphingomonas sp. IC-56 TaxID=2898529 RepID=UPI001E5B72BB|nr:GPW/gp25 family protein [Sphingomonas sp. IC-56]MCD2324178.1 GPW/gp25 family protein [Sphingomonas sp. IC-56]